MLSDDKLVSAINIPGTHNSATFAKKTLLSAPGDNGKCQNQTFESQLAHGIRFFDLRLEKHGDGFRFCHGRLISYELMLHSVFNLLKDFLKSNSREFIFVSVKEDGGDDITKAWENKYGDELILYEGNHFPKVKECRGKIILLSRLPNAKKGFRVAWENNTKLDLVHRDTYQYAVQDYYDVNLEQSYKKISAITEFLAQTGDMGETTLRICFTSSAGMYSGIETGSLNLPHPKGAADRINPIVLKELRKLPKGAEFGLLIMDFPSQELIETIVRSNRLT